MKVAGIDRIACLGTGTMGPGVAFLCAKAGYEVTLFGRSEASVKRGLVAVDTALKLYINNGLMSVEDESAVKGRISGVTSLAEAAQNADLVIESVAEVLAVKQEVFRAVEEIIRPDAILATDTSGLSPGKIASVLKNPERFVVAHFINPPHLIPAVEVVPCPRTLPGVVALTSDWVKSIGNVPIEMKQEIPGFIINRLQFACLREALYMVEQGWATAESVDAAMRYSLGRRYPVTGPLETVDLGGVDIFANVGDYLFQELCSTEQPSGLLRKTADVGRLGAKSGQGIYEWDGEKLAKLKAAREKELIEWLKKDRQAANENE